MDATLTELTLTPAALAVAVAASTSPLAPRIADAPDAGVLRDHGLVDENGALNEAGSDWFRPLREPSYVFRIERAAMDVEAAQSIYVSLQTQRCLHVVAEADDSLTLTEAAVADVIYSGLIEAAGIWPDTHPDLDADADPPAGGVEAEGALITTVVSLRVEEGSIIEHEFSFLDLGEEGAWRIDDGRLIATTDLELFQQLPWMLHVEDR